MFLYWLELSNKKIIFEFCHLVPELCYVFWSQNTLGKMTIFEIMDLILKSFFYNNFLRGTFFISATFLSRCCGRLQRAMFVDLFNKIEWHNPLQHPTATAQKSCTNKKCSPWKVSKEKWFQNKIYDFENGHFAKCILGPKIIT